MIANKLEETKDFLKERGIEKIDVAIITGTGLDNSIPLLKESTTIFYKDIPYFPVPTTNHPGKFVVGNFNKMNIGVLNGRVHYYEGFSLEEVTYYIRTLAYMGVKYLIISNAAGGLNTSFNTGDFVIIKDHINLIGDNPLIGKDIDNRFITMKKAYDEGLREELKNILLDMKLPPHEGVYAAVHGPSLETNAEYNFIRIIGADMVGMSTVPEVIMARYFKMKVAGISIITNMASDEHAEGKEVETVAKKRAVFLKRIFEKLLGSIS